MLKTLKKIAGVLSVGLMAISPLSVYAEEQDSVIRILFTGNLRNHLGSTKQRDPDTKELLSVGGYDRLYTTLQAETTESTLKIDMGNYSTGSGIYDCLYDSAESYTLLHKMGYDCVGTGERELAYGTDRFISMVNSTEEKPQVVASNLSGYDNTSTIIEKGGKQFGIFSVISKTHALVLGEDVLENEKESAEKAVRELKDADYTICLYDGTLEEGKQLVEAVDGISLVLCAGEIDTTEKVEKVKDTLLVTGGAYGQTVGRLDLYGDTLKLKNYEVLEVNGESNETMRALVNAYTDQAQSALGVKLDTLAGHVQIDMDDPLLEDMSVSNTRTQDMVLDAYADMYTSHADHQGSFAIAVSNKYSFKGGIYEGDIHLKELYDCADIGSDDILYTAYIQGYDVKRLCELDHMYGDANPLFKMAFSGVKYTYLDKRTKYNTVKDVYVEESRGYWAKMDNDKYYPIVFTDSFMKVLHASSIVEDGILQVRLYKSSTGEGEVTDSLEDCVMKDSHDNILTCMYSIKDFIQDAKRNSNAQHDITSAYSQKDTCRTQEKLTLMNLISNPSEYAFHSYVYYGKAAAVIIIGLMVITAVWNRCHPNRKG